MRTIPPIIVTATPDNHRVISQSLFKLSQKFLHRINNFGESALACWFGSSFSICKTVNSLPQEGQLKLWPRASEFTSMDWPHGQSNFMFVATSPSRMFGSDAGECSITTSTYAPVLRCIMSGSVFITFLYCSEICYSIPGKAINVPKTYNEGYALRVEIFCIRLRGHVRFPVADPSAPMF